MITEESKDFITSIARCMDVIRAFDSKNAEMTPADVAVKTNLTRATARRILLTLNTLGYVASDGKWFRLSPKILDLGFSYLTSMRVINRPPTSSDDYFLFPGPLVVSPG
jgi:IclR family pca regulon transcriptional regulator